MTSVSYNDFSTVYRQAVRDVLAHWNVEMQAEMSAHNIGWHPSKFRFDGYLEASVSRYFRAYRDAVSTSTESLCDVGGFWGVFPLTLKRLGFDISMTEALKYYSESFSKLFGYIQSEGVNVLDYDPFDPTTRLDRTFDGLFVMAVLEHYPHSLRDFMTNVLVALTPSGKIYIEVPNIAYWPKRIALLRGTSPNPPVGDIYHSRVPFTGHHHEYTEAELRELASLSGLRITHFEHYNYSVGGSAIGRLLRAPIKTLALSLVPSAREILAMTCTRVAA